MSWRPHHLGEILADLEQQYARGDIDIVTWERERQHAIADDANERRITEGEQ